MEKFNYREAGRYLADLRKEVEGKMAMLNIAEATVQSKKQLEVVKGALSARKEEVERYKSLVGIAKQDAEDAEDAAMLRISTASSRALKEEESISARVDTALDNLKIVEDECNAEAERLNADIADRLNKSDEIIQAAKEREEAAITKADQAEAALRKIGKLTGGAV